MNNEKNRHLAARLYVLNHACSFIIIYLFQPGFSQASYKPLMHDLCAKFSIDVFATVVCVNSELFMIRNHYTTCCTCQNWNTVVRKQTLVARVDTWIMSKYYTHCIIKHVSCLSITLIVL